MSSGRRLPSSLTPPGARVALEDGRGRRVLVLQEDPLARQAGWGRVAGCTRRGCIFLSRECGSLGEEGGGTRSQTRLHLEQQLFWAPSCRARAGVPGARKRRSFRGRSGGGAGPAPRTGGLGGEGRRQRHQPRHPGPRAPTGAVPASYPLAREDALHSGGDRGSVLGRALGVRAQDGGASSASPGPGQTHTEPGAR